MARKAGIDDEPRLLAEIKRRAVPLLDTRPPGALTARELASAAGVSYDVIRHKLAELRAEGNLREARLRMTRGGGYTMVYWLD